MRLLLVLIAVLTAVPASRAQSALKRDYTSGSKLARQILDGVMAEGRFPGLAVSVAVGDTIVYAEGFGFARLEPEEAATPDHLFRIYSVAKTMTGAAAAKLFQEGRLDLDAPIQTYMPSLNVNLHGITTMQLLGHTAGIRHYRRGEWLRISKDSCASPFDALPVFVNDKPARPPGRKAVYSSFGYVLLSAVIEVASGQPYVDYMAEEVFDPLRMETTRLDNPKRRAPLQAWGYERRRGRFVRARYVDNSCKMGAGGFLSSSNDLALFGMALVNHRLVSPETLELMLTPMLDSEGKTGYGFGIGIGTDEDGRIFGIHSGGAIGGRSALVIYPRQKVVVAITANSEGRRLTSEAKSIAKLFVQ